MSTRGNHSSSTLLVVLALIITFPFWIAIGAVVFGLLAGLIGALFGIGGAIFGVLVTIVTLPFRIIFGWGDHGWHGWHFHHNGVGILVFVIIIALIMRSKNK